jgi:hypothetical protein
MDLLIGGRRSRPISTFTQICIVRDWILRAQSLPLILKIEALKEGGLERIEGILDAISQSSTRRLSLSLDMSNALLRSFHHSNFPYPHLKKLQNLLRARLLLSTYLIIEPESEPRSNRHPWRSFQVAPNIVEPSAAIDFDYVTDVIQLFENASQMTSCRISLVPYFIENVSTFPAIIHQRLKVFGLFNATEPQATSIFSFQVFKHSIPTGQYI